jgi:hypothetical protein
LRKRILKYPFFFKGYPLSSWTPMNALLTTGDINSGYGFYLKANYWILSGFSVKTALKGIMLDGASFNILTNLTISNIGTEGAHFRCASTDNTLKYSQVTNTGRQVGSEGYGEAVYIGTAISNWASYSCLKNGPDYSHRNKILNNILGPRVTAEMIDSKEGTMNGTLEGNTFDGKNLCGLTDAISWVNMKGAFYKISKNFGFNSLWFGFRVRPFLSHLF